MSQGIVIDVQAQVTGYQASLKQLEQALQHIDAGSAIGKQLASAFDDANKQVKALGRNLSQRATSEGQIDAIVEKANRAGIAVQKVAELMQNVQIKDVNFDSFGEGVKNLQSQIQVLNDELRGNLLNGIQDAISKNTLLQKSFEKVLEIDPTGKGPVELLEAVKQKAVEAEAQVKKAQKTLDSLNAKKGDSESKLKKDEQGLFGSAESRNELMDQVRTIEAEYEKIFSGLRDKLSKGLKDKLGTDSGLDPQILIDNFFQGLTPETLQAKINELYDSLAGAKIYQRKVDFYSEIFGGGKNINQVMSQINLGDPKVVGEKLRAFVDTIASEIGGKNKAIITDLIDAGQIEQATAVTLANITTAYGKVQNRIQKEKDTIKDLNEQISGAQNDVTQAQGAQKAVDTINAKLQAQIARVEKENESLRQRISDAEAQLKALQEGKVGQLKQQGAGIGNSAETFKLGTNEANKYKDALDRVHAGEQMIGKIQGVVERWFSIYAAVRMVGNAIRSVISTIKDLDKTITEIAIVTDMTQSDLWGQMDTYTAMARQYGTSISGVYKVSQLYYQQGLQTTEVMKLTEQTLKMARISGLDYATATDYMTNAIRSFKMEMSDAQKVVDVYSAVAASSATDTSELATAMSKTASSAEAVGSSFENTTAMMAVMIEATRESAENIGSAMKSIISRYGEMTSDPNAITDSEGEAMSLNRVDKALQTVGITIHDTAGQFRDFDDVIMELAQKWDTIDTNTQRYIATIMAGNRQQSRFLALVSNYDRLSELSEEAANSQDAATLQVLKTMDSIEVKTQQLQTSLQSLYTSSGLEGLYKNILDIGNNIVKTFTMMPTFMGLPIAAIANFGLAFTSLANVVTNVFALLKAKFAVMQAEIQAKITSTTVQGVNTRLTLTQQEMERVAEAWANNAQQYDLMQDRMNRSAANGAKTRSGIAQGEAVPGTQASGGRLGQFLTKHRMAVSTALSIGGLALSTFGANTKGAVGGLAGMAGTGLQGASLGLSIGGPWGAAIGGALGLITGAISNWTKVFPTLADQIKEAQENAINKTNTYLQKKAKTTDLNSSIENLKKLEAARFDSLEAEQAYYEAANKFGSEFPGLIESVDAAGNVIIDLDAAMVQLANSTQEAVTAAQEAAIANYNAAKKQKQQAEDEYDQAEQDLGFDIKNAVGQYYQVYSGTTEASDGTKIAQAFIDSYREAMNSDRLFSEIFADTVKSQNIDVGEYEFFDSDWSVYQQTLNAIGQTTETSFGDLSENAVNLLEALNNSAIDINDYILKNADAYNAEITDSEESEFSKTILKIALLSQNVVNNQLAGLNRAASVLESAEKSGIAQVVGASTAAMTGVVKEMTDAGSVLTNYLANMDGAKNDYENFINNQLPNELETAIQDLTTFWESLSPKQQTQFNDLIKNKSKYSQTAWLQAVAKLVDGMANLPTFIADSLYEDTYNYDKYAQAIEQRKTNRQDSEKQELQEFNLNGKTRGALGASQLTNLLNVYDTIAKQLDNEAITSDQANKFISEYSNILNNIFSLKDVTPEIKAQAAELITGWEDFSVSGFFDLSDKLSDLGIDYTGILDQVQNLYRYISVNLESEIQVLTQKITKQFEDFDKAVSNASKGMDAKTALAMAQKLGTTLSEGFTFKDGKYFLDDITALKDAYLKYNESLYTQLSTDVQNIKNYFDNGNDWGDIDDAQKAQYEQIIKTYTDIYNSLDKETRDKISLGDYIKERLDKVVSDAKTLTNDYADYQVNSILITNGRIADFIKNVMGKDTEESKISEWISEMAKGNFDQLPEELQAYASELWKYYSGTQKAVFESAIKSLESGEKTMVKVTEQNKEFLQKYGKPVKEGVDINNLAEGDEVWLDIDKSQIPQLQQDIAQAVIDKTISKESANSLLAQLQNIRFKGNRREVFENVLKSYDNFSYELMQSITDQTGRTIKQLTDLGYFKRDPLTGAFSATVDGLNFLYDRLQQTRNVSQKDLNKYKAQIDEIANEDNTNVILEDIIKNRQSLSTTNVASLATMLGTDYDTVLSMLQDNGNGTYRLGLGTIQSIIDAGQGKVSDTVINMLAEEIDNIVASVTGLVSGQTKGYTNMADMQKVVSNLKNNGYTQINGEDLNIQSLFKWDEEVHAFVLNTIGMIAQVKNAKDQLARYEDGTDEFFVYSKILNDMKRQFAEQVNIMSFIGAEDKTFSDFGTTNAELSKASQTLVTGLQNYNDYLTAISQPIIDINKFVTNLKSGGSTAVQTAQQWAEISGIELSANDISEIYLAQVKPITEAIDQLLYQPGAIVNEVAGKILAEQGKAEQIGTTGQYLVTGVADLYKAYQAIYNKLLNTNEATLGELNSVQAAMMESKDGQQRTIDILGNAANMTYTQMAEFFTKAGYEFTETLMQEMTNEGIIEHLGGAHMRIKDFDSFAQMLQLQGGSEEYWSALSTYNNAIIEFNHKLETDIYNEVKSLESAKAGDWINLTRLSNELYSNLIPEGYIGNVDLKNRPIVLAETMQKAYAGYIDEYSTLFTTTFAAALDQNDENGIEGLAKNLALNFTPIIDANTVLSFNELHDYVQQLVTDANGELEKIIALDSKRKNLFLDMAEVDGSTSDAIEAASAQAESLHKAQAAWYDLQYKLSQAGATLENGILKISEENGNIPAIMAALINSVQLSGTLATQQEAELLDALNNNLKTYTDALGAAISGTASNVQAQKIQSWADRAGVKVDFTKTANGLKISRDAAIELYNVLRGIDALSAGIVFNSLSESLKKAGEDCENISKTMANVAKMEDELGKNPNNTKLQQRLDLYRQIASTQMQDPESYNFMGRKLPDYLQGPKNYWDSVGKAYEAMNEAFKGTKVSGVKGKMHLMEIDDFYNIVNEMSNLAQITDTDLVFAGQTIAKDGSTTAELINKGLSALTNIDGKGVKVNLGKLGFNFSTSADNMTKDFDTAVKEMANAQIEMLDGMIQLLEAVVAMEELGKIDIDSDGIEFEEMFNQLGENSYKATESAKNAAQNILDSATNNKDLTDALDNLKFNNTTLRSMLEGLAGDAELTEEQATLTFSALTSLYGMFLSGDYDLDKLMTSIAQVASENGFKGEMQIDAKRKIAIGYGTILESNGEGEYIVDGKPYKDPQVALKAYAVKQDPDISDVTIEGGEPIGVIQTQQVDYEIKVQAGEDGTLHYILPDGTDTTSKNDAVWKLYNQYVKDQTENGAPKTEIVSYEQFKAKLHLDSKVEIVNQDKFASATHDQIQALAQALLNNNQEDIKITAKNIGVEVEFDANGKMKESQYQQLAEIAHFEDKTVSMHLGANFNGDGGAKLEKLLSEDGIQVKVDITPSDAAEKLGDLAEASEKVESGELENLASAAENLSTNLSTAVTSLTAFNALSTVSIATIAASFDHVSESLELVSQSIGKISEVSFDNFSTLSTQLKTVADQVEQIWTTIQNISSASLNITYNNQVDDSAQESTITQTISSSVVLNTEDAQKACSALSEAAKAVAGPLENAATKIKRLSDTINNIPAKAYLVNNLVNAMNAIPSNASGFVSNLASAMRNIPDASGKISNLIQTLNRIPSSKNIAITATVDVKATGGTVTSQTPTKTNRVSIVKATGNVALAKGRGPRHKTLMGELGPELVVSGGEYFVVGENGAEMFDLPDDAIVFNHLQTKKLLANGTANGRGRAVKNERTSVALASGNTSGPAMASARAALAALKQIRAMWQSMAKASSKDLGSQAGRNSGGGGGGGSGNKDNTKDNKVEGWQATNSTAEIQRWYNLLRQIEKIEKEITHQNNLQDALLSSRIANGKAIYQSQKKELSLLTDEITKNRELSYLQKSWYDNKRRELENSGYGMIFTYNEQGLQQYVDGPNRGLDVLEKLTARDINGQATGYARTSKTQLDYLQSIGFDTNSLIYNDDGTKVFEWINGVMSKADTGEAMTDKEKDEAYTKMMDNFWDNLDGWRDELDGIYDSYNEQLNTVLENEAKRNEILKEIADNQLAVEEAVLNAITEREQAVIDNLQDQRDALEDASQKYIDGLQDSLNKEKQQYQDQQEAENLNKLRRQLLILQRSGGSGSQIRNLQEQIRSKEQDAYFAAQQEQINAIKEASDAEIERLDAQIDLLTETLEYQKEHGLLWEEVQQIMSGDVESIATFIHENTAEWDGKSALAQFEEDLELKKQLGQWTEYRDDTETYWTNYLGQGGTVEQAVQGLDESQWQTYDDSMHNIFGNTWDGYRLKAEEAFNKILEETGDSTLANVNTTDSLGLNLGDAVHNKNSISHSGVSSLAPSLSALPSSQQVAVASNNGIGQNTFASYARDFSPEQHMSVASRLITNRGTEWKSDSTKHWKENTHADGSIEKVNVGTHNKDKKVDTGSTWTCYCSVCNHYMGVSYKTPAEQGPTMHRDNTFDTISSASPTPKTTTNKEIKSTNNSNAAKASVERTTNAVKAVANKITTNATAIVDNFKKLMSFKEGGEVNFTGLAMVHGTSQHPEYVLNAEQYKILKDGMLSGANTLSGTINSINNSIHNTANAKDLNNVNNGTESIVIEKAEVNMNVAQLANDYDARRAGAAALDEMVRIARKSGTRTLSRR